MKYHYKEIDYLNKTFGFDCL
jgi:hypothetical protein